LTAEIRERIKQLPSYSFGVADLGGGHVWTLDGGDQERWALWVSGRFLVKIGAPEGEQLPEDVIAEYMDVYPSDLDERGLAEAGAASAGPSQRDKRERAQDELDLPRHLREGAPR
jgi:hypothetical protein